MKAKAQNLFFFLIIAVLIFIVYGDVFKTFFILDEWSWFGRFMYWNSLGPVPFLRSFLMGFRVNYSSYFMPLGWFAYAVAVQFLGLEFSRWAALGLVLYFFNTILVFYLAKSLTKRQDISLLTALFFAVSSIHFIAIIWVWATLVALGAAAFSFLSLIFFVNYLEKEKRRFFWYSLVSLWLALGFKVNAIFVFPFIPVYWLFFYKGRMSKQIKRDFYLFLINAAFFLGLVLLLHYFGRKSQISGLIWTGSPFLSLSAIAYQLVTLPLKAFSQVFVFSNHIYLLAEKWLKLAHPHFFGQEPSVDPDVISQTLGAELVSYVLTAIFLVIISRVFFLLRKTRRDYLARVLVFACWLISASVLPVVFLLLRGQKMITPLIGSIELYYTSTGAALLLSIIIFFLAEKLIKEKMKFLRYGFVFLTFTLFFFYHYRILKNEVFPFQTNMAKQRKKILDQIKEKYPKIASKSIFYTESDTAYYGNIEPSLPFDTGFGRTILSWYSYYTKNPPWDFFEDDFLYRFNEEGYREIHGRGFGYFHQFDELIETLEKNNLSPESVYAFSWRGKTDELLDITDQVRQRIKK